jgi:hypothetical protein
MSVAGWKTNMMRIYFHMDGMVAARQVVFKDGGKVGPAGEEGQERTG